MNSNDPTYIGIDPTSGNKDFGYAVLDSNLGLVMLAEADMEELVPFLEKQSSVVVAISSPRGANRGLVKNKIGEEGSGFRRALRSMDIRLAEYELRERGIAVAGTPAREEFCPAWMQTGFTLYKRLSQIGFKPFEDDEAGCRVIETHPFACFCVLAETIPFPKPTLEGRLQRQLILNDRGLRVKDAMNFFEEITRFKLMKGILPTGVLYSAEQLDVLVAAYTAWMSVHHPGDVIKMGDKVEGQITLPVRELKAKY
jgi:predicted nuclease with RNAse H fold